MKPEWWGSPLVQEKYQEEKACDKRHPYSIIMIIIIIIIIIISQSQCKFAPIPGAAQSDNWFCGSWLPGITGSNSDGGMDVYLL